MLYIEYPKDSTKKLLEIISKFSKLVGYKICCFLYINNKEIKKIGPFTIPSKNKTPRNKFNQRDENTCTPKTKILMKEIDEGISKLKDISHSWIRRIIIIKMPIVHEAIYRFSAITIKIRVAFFTEVEQAVPKLVWNHSRLRRAKTILRKENKAGGVTFPDFKPNYRAIGTKTSLRTKLVEVMEFQLSYFIF